MIRRWACVALLLANGMHITTVSAGHHLIISVTNFPDDVGAAGVALWNGARGFPEDIRHAIRATYVNIHGRRATAAFADVPPGVYAVTVLHDRNSNRKLDKNFIGMPKEAWGVSNNSRPHLRAPRFDEARLQIDRDQTIEIRVAR